MRVRRDARSPTSGNKRLGRDALFSPYARVITAISAKLKKSQSLVTSDFITSCMTKLVYTTKTIGERRSTIFPMSINVDQIYDGLLQNGVRPFVEISFMPKKLALGQDVHPFWYKQIVAPPKDYQKWDDLIRAFAQHLVDRYGLNEVAEWYFEVWNEPNIDFWTGDPKQATYFELYDHTARALKSVSPRLRVGGPSTSSAH